MNNFRLPSLVLGSSLAALVAFTGTLPVFPQEPAEKQEEEKVSKALKAIAESEAIFVGASKCKSCHNKESAGHIYDKWEKASHAKAFETLKSPEAQAIAKERGLEDASKAAECVKCHDTAFTEPKERKHRRFAAEKGVSCETCHGPGSDHIKARLAAAKADETSSDAINVLPEGEMILPDKLLCKSCHNEESPSYKEFDFGKRLEEIRHLHPLREKPRVVAPKPKKEGEAETEG
jgi:hypothetical protein